MPHSASELSPNENITLLCQEIVGEVANNSCNQTGASRLFKIMKTRLGPYLPDHVLDLMPGGWRGIENVAGIHRPVSFRMQACSNECRFFSREDPNDVICGLCEHGSRYDEHGEPDNEALYYDLEDYVKRLYSIPEVATMLSTWWDVAQSNHTPGVYRDSNDGSIIRGLDPNNDTFFMELTCYSVVKYVQSKRTRPLLCSIIILCPNISELVSVPHSWLVFYPRLRSRIVFG